MAINRSDSGRSDVATNPQTQKETSGKGGSGRGETAGDVMTPNPQTVSSNERLQQVAQMMLECDCGAIPVVENNKVIGIITDRDIVVRVLAKGQNPLETNVSQAMTRGVETVRQNEKLDRVMEIMSRHQIRRVPVVDDQDRVIGMIAQADLVTEADDEDKVERTIERISEPGGEQRPRR